MLGVVEREGRVETKIVPSKHKRIVSRKVADRVKHGTRISTDEGMAFSMLREYGFTHTTVNLSKGEYVHGLTRTNTIEGFWNLFKGAYRGTYVRVSPKYLDLYLDEFEFRWNLRKSPEKMLPSLLQGFSRPVAH